MYGLLTIVIVVLTAIGFASMFGVSIYKIWRTPPGGPPPDPGEAFTYVATGIAALIGGIVALGFGVKPPMDATDGVGSSLMSLGTLMGGWGDDKLREILGGLYGVMYISFATAAIVTWLARPRLTITLVKNLSTTFLGMSLTIVLTFFDRH